MRIKTPPDGRLISGLCFLLVMFVLFWACPSAQAAVSQQSVSGHQYTAYLPDSYDPAVKSPLVLVLHHSTGRGVDMIERWKEPAGKLGFIIIAPDSKDSRFWGIPEEAPAVLEVLADARGKYTVDDTRIYVSGFSAGATFAFYLGLTRPDIFAATAPFAGSLLWAEKNAGLEFGGKKRIPVFILHGKNDITVPPEEAVHAEQRLKGLGYKVKLMLVPGLDHQYPAGQTWLIAKWFASRVPRSDEKTTNPEAPISSTDKKSEIVFL